VTSELSVAAIFPVHWIVKRTSGDGRICGGVIDSEDVDAVKR
jgi:hypothetical protein